MANKALKFRLYPNQEQQILLAKTFGCCRFVYNMMLSDKIKHYEQTGEMLKVTPAVYKKAFGWLREVDSLALCNSALHLDTAFKNFFSKRAKYPRFKSKKSCKKSYVTNCVNGNIKIEDNYIKLPKLGSVRFKKHRSIPNDWRLKSVTVMQNPSGKYYASVLFEYDNQVSQVKPASFIGLDFSMHELYVDSEGNDACYPRYYRQAEKKLKREQRKLSHMQKGSHNRYKQRLKVAKMHEKVSNQRRDFLHKLSCKLADSYDCVCIEDLNMKAMSQSLSFGKSVSDNGWGMFLNFLAYKLSDRGKRLVKIDKFFPSSQMCHVCGEVNPITKDLSVRQWICSCCGTNHNRDHNAAINIRNEGRRLVTV